MYFSRIFINLTKAHDLNYLYMLTLIQSSYSKEKRKVILSYYQILLSEFKK